MLSPMTGPPPQFVDRRGISQIFSPVVALMQRNGAPRGRGLTGECSLCDRYTLPPATKATCSGQLLLQRISLYASLASYCHKRSPVVML